MLVSLTSSSNFTITQVSVVLNWNRCNIVSTLCIGLAKSRSPVISFSVQIVKIGELFILFAFAFVFGIVGNTSRNIRENFGNGRSSTIPEVFSTVPEVFLTMPGKG